MATVQEKCVAFGKQFSGMEHAKQGEALTQLRAQVAKMPTRGDGDDPYVQLLARCEKIYKLSDPGLVDDDEDDYDDDFDEDEDGQDAFDVMVEQGTEPEPTDDGGEEYYSYSASEPIDADETQVPVDDIPDYDDGDDGVVSGFDDMIADAPGRPDRDAAFGGTGSLLETGSFVQSDEPEDDYGEDKGKAVEASLVVEEDELSIAAPLRRLGAYLLDGLLALPAMICLGISIPGIMASMLFGGGGGMMILAGIGFLLCFIPLVVTIIFWKKSSSFGKNMLGLYVFDIAKDRRASFGTMFLRDFVCRLLPGFAGGIVSVILGMIGLGIIGSIVTLLAVLGWYGAILFTPNRQAGHDMMLKTLVIQRPRADS